MQDQKGCKKNVRAEEDVKKQATSAYCRDKCSVATTVQQSIQSTLSISDSTTGEA